MILGHKDFDLTNYNSYRVKSKCKQAFLPNTEEEVINIYKDKQPIVLLGSGHNIILSKTYYDETFVIFNGNFSKTSIDENLKVIEVEAGVFMKDLCVIALEHNLSGLEIFYDIPSSIGGAVVMNAGASGEEIKSLVTKVRYLDLKTMQIKEMQNSEIDFEYRNSYFQKNPNNVILKVWLQLHFKSKSEIREKMNRIKAQRYAKQPKDYPNAGSVFKRPKGYYVGAIMEDLNLKGFSVGGAKISEKHGGFIINFNNATGQDILDVINGVKKRVKKAYNVNLEVEQRII